MSRLRITVFGDTHGKHEEVTLPQNSDILIFTGDMMSDGYKLWEITRFMNWFNHNPAEIKIMIGGNHDRILENMPSLWGSIQESYPNIVYLENNYVEVAGITIWGSPDSKFFRNWAFNRSEEQLKRVYDSIPEETNILITHPPAWGILDELVDGQHVGEEALLERVRQLPMLDYHLFGHIHNAYGIKRISEEYAAINASICNEDYETINKPVTFEYETRKSGNILRPTIKRTEESRCCS